MKTIKTIIIILVTAAIVGGGVWYYQKLQNDKDKEALNNQITDLKKNDVSSAVSDENPAGPTATQEAVTWKTYKNGKYGFNLQYPSTWKIAEGVVDNGDKSVVTIDDPATAEPSDFVVYYYLSVAEEAENQAQNLGAKTIDDLVAKDDAITKIGAVTLGGLPATDMYWKTTGQSYAILAMQQDHLFKVWLGGVSDKDKLTDIDQKVLASFQFTE